MSRRSKHQVNKKVWLGILLVVILLIVGFIGFRSRVVNARIQSFFGDNQTAQKIEYQKQRQTAQKKYGEVSQSSNSSSTKKRRKVTPQQTALKNIAVLVRLQTVQKMVLIATMW